MQGHNLTDNVKTVRAKAASAAGATDIESDIMDTLGFEGIRFIVPFGTITSGAVTSVKAQQDVANAAGGMADIIGTGITVADTDDDKLVILDIFRPKERYVRCVVKRATQNAVVGEIIAELYRPGLAAVTKDASVSSQEIHVNPAEGTA